MDLEEARTHWIAVREEYCAFAELLSVRLDGIAKELGIHAQISARAKETHSLVKKLLAKPHLSYETLPDKVGARIVVRYLSEIAPLEQCIQERFIHEDVEDKSKKLGTNKLGYQSIHIDSVALPKTDELSQRFPADSFFGEIQLRTLSQHLWSEISHDTFYKNDELVHQLSVDLQRRVNLTAGLVEVADREFNRMNAESKPDTAIQVFGELERLYYSVASKAPNVELSLEVINLILPLYGGLSAQEIMRDYVSPRFERDRQELQEIYKSNDIAESKISAFLFQPEAFLLLERLHFDRDQLLTKWNEKFPERELDRFAVAMGFSLE